jgi:hypothetical protein
VFLGEKMAQVRPVKPEPMMATSTSMSCVMGPSSAGGSPAVPIQ